METWRNVVSGHADNVSPENEEEWRRTLFRLCERIENRARSRLEAMTALDFNDDWSPTSFWQKWMADNVVALWREERDVAEAVMQSIVSGVEF